MQVFLSTVLSRPLIYLSPPIKPDISYNAAVAAETSPMPGSKWKVRVWEGSSGQGVCPSQGLQEACQDLLKGAERAIRGRETRVLRACRHSAHPQRQGKDPEDSETLQEPDRALKHQERSSPEEKGSPWWHKAGESGRRGLI